MIEIIFLSGAFTEVVETIKYTIISYYILSIKWYNRVVIDKNIPSQPMSNFLV